MQSNTALLLHVDLLHQTMRRWICVYAAAAAAFAAFDAAAAVHLVLVDQLLLQLLQPLQAPCSDDELAPRLCQAPRNSFTKAGAGT
jgi:hypothetical protein